MAQSPLQTVKSKFGGRSDLIEKLAGMVDDLNDDGADGVKSRLGGLTNKKLLRLYKIEQAVREKYGDRDKLIAHILDANKTAGRTSDDGYRAKLSTYSKGQLLDLTRRGVGTATPKQTPEQRLKTKRGRKALARAKAKLGTA